MVYYNKKRTASPTVYVGQVQWQWHWRKAFQWKYTHTTIQNIYSLSNEMLLHKQGNKGSVDVLLYFIINVDDGLWWTVMHMEKYKMKWNEKKSVLISTGHDIPFLSLTKLSARVLAVIRQPWITSGLSWVSRNFTHIADSDTFVKKRHLFVLRT